MSPARMVFAAVALALVACTEAPVAVETDLEPQFARGRVVESASGSGHFFYDPTGDDPNTHRVFSFTAREHADGTVSGKFQLQIMASVFGSENPAITRYLHADVICLSVDRDSFSFPNAWIAGEITNSSIPGNIGKGVWFRVTDRGEGNSAPADLISTTRPFPLDETSTPANAIAQCEANTPRGRFQVSQGNIQVR